MNLTLRQIGYVCETARLGSVQAASQSMRISQSSILAAIDLAERDLGARIFNRRPARGVITTPAGERFLAAARVLLSARDDFSRALGTLTEPASQPLRIGCLEPFGPVFMSDLLRRYVDKVGPAVIQLFVGHQAQLQEWLSTGVVDLVLAYDI